MKKRIILLILLAALLLDVQRVSAAETPKLRTVTGIITSINNDSVYWDDGNDIYYFYGAGYSIGETIINVMCGDVHVFIGVNENA